MRAATVWSETPLPRRAITTISFARTASAPRRMISSSPPGWVLPDPVFGNFLTGGSFFGESGEQL
jgi:hypothetical protein